MSFGLSRFDLDKLTYRLELPQISEDPAKPLALILRYAGPGNRSWEAWNFRSPMPEPRPDPATLEGQAVLKARFRDVMPVAGIAGWENVIEDGIQAEFTPEAAARFFAELHDTVPSVLVIIANVASDRDNFLKSPALDAGDLGKG